MEINFKRRQTIHRHWFNGIERKQRNLSNLSHQYPYPASNQNQQHHHHPHHHHQHQHLYRHLQFFKHILFPLSILAFIQLHKSSAFSIKNDNRIDTPQHFTSNSISKEINEQWLNLYTNLSNQMPLNDANALPAIPSALPTLLLTTENSTREILLNTTTATTPPIEWLTAGRFPSKNKMNFDSIFYKIIQRYSTGNELWDYILRDCYNKPSYTCFQKQVYIFLNDALEAKDVNVTQHLKFYLNHNKYEYNETTTTTTTTTATYGDDDVKASPKNLPRSPKSVNIPTSSDIPLKENIIPPTNNHDAKHKSIPQADVVEEPEVITSPIEEVTNALYGKSMKFALTHDIELQLPDILFDGAILRISPRSMEGNGMLVKLDLMPKQANEARLAGKIILQKLQKLVRNKILLSFLALLLIIKIIKIKIFWFLPLIIGVSAAKKLLLKFLLFLFPALSHLFKLCSYYQQTYHSTKYHHHHHLIDHHHTILPPWYDVDSSHGPEIIYTQPPKGPPSSYKYGPVFTDGFMANINEHYDNGWESSGPGLGSEYINDINRIAQIDENTNNFKLHKKNPWNLNNALQPNIKKTQTHKTKPSLGQRISAQAIIGNIHKTLQPITVTTATATAPATANSAAQSQKHLKPVSTSQTFNPLLHTDKQSYYSSKYRGNMGAPSAPNPIYAQMPNEINQKPPQHKQQFSKNRNTGHPQTNLQTNIANDPNRPHQNPYNQQQHHYHQHHHHPHGSNIQQQQQQQHQLQQQQQHQLQQQQQQQQQQQLHQPSPMVQHQAPISPEFAAQLKEALRIQAEQQLIQQQQHLLNKEPFVQNSGPMMSLNYDEFYSPILAKIDKILDQLGIMDEFCKERLICNMYKNPMQYSPHSNFISAELSRDTSELPQAKNKNTAVIRFFRLIQAARDGQDQKDCAAIYTKCFINNN